MQRTGRSSPTPNLWGHSQEMPVVPPRETDVNKTPSQASEGSNQEGGSTPTGGPPEALSSAEPKSAQVYPSQHFASMKLFENALRWLWEDRSVDNEPIRSTTTALIEEARGEEAEAVTAPGVLDATRETPQQAPASPGLAIEVVKQYGDVPVEDLRKAFLSLVAHAQEGVIRQFIVSPHEQNPVAALLETYAADTRIPVQQRQLFLQDLLTRYPEQGALLKTLVEQLQAPSM